MALDGYSGLKTGIQDFIARTDTTAYVDYFIDLAEAWFNKELRTRAMETTNGSMTATAGLVTHPSDFLGWKSLSVVANGLTYPLKPISLERRRFYDDGSTGLPAWYVVRGSQTLLVPSPDGTYTYEGTYYQKIPALSASQTSNWVLDSHPDAYLFGALAMTEAFYKDDSRVQGWKTLAEQAVDGIKRNSRDADLGQAPTMAYEGPIY